MLSSYAYHISIARIPGNGICFDSISFDFSFDSRIQMRVNKNFALLSCSSLGRLGRIVSIPRLFKFFFFVSICDRSITRAFKDQVGAKIRDFVGNDSIRFS